MPPSYVVASSSFESSWRGCGQSPRRGQACARPREGGVGTVRGMLTWRGDCRHREGDVDMARGSLTWRGGRWHREGDITRAHADNARRCGQRALMPTTRVHAASPVERVRSASARGSQPQAPPRQPCAWRPSQSRDEARHTSSTARRGAAASSIAWRGAAASSIGRRKAAAQPIARRGALGQGSRGPGRSRAAPSRRTATALRRTGPVVSAPRSRGTGSSRGLSPWPRGTAPSCPPACTPAPRSAICPCPTGGRAVPRHGR